MVVIPYFVNLIAKTRNKACLDREFLSAEPESFASHFAGLTEETERGLLSSPTLLTEVDRKRLDSAEHAETLPFDVFLE